jgi:hypothetical protein
LRKYTGFKIAFVGSTIVDATIRGAHSIERINLGDELSDFEL